MSANAPDAQRDAPAVEADKPRGPMPWFKWWSRDWLGNPEVRELPLAARGLAADLRSLAHQLTEPGKLAMGGKPLTEADIARKVSAPIAQVRAMLPKLEAAGILRREGDTYIVPEIAKAVHLSTVRAEAGRRGAAASHGVQPPSGPDRKDARGERIEFATAKPEFASANGRQSFLKPWEAKERITECEREIARTRADPECRLWDGGLKGGLKPDALARVDSLKASIVEARKSLTGVP